MVSKRSRPFVRLALCAPLIVLTLAVTSSFAQAPADAYLIGPQDVLAINVWDQPDLNGKFTVESDGTFSFPLIGRTKAGGLTLRQFEGELKKKLADGFFRNPEVTVSIEQYRSQRVFVVGEVRNPGPYQLSGKMSLIEVLSRAGSTLPTAADEVIIVRGDPGNAAAGPLIPDSSGTNSARQTVRVDINNLQNGTGENIALLDNDTVYVPAAPTVYVYGQVKNPGPYPIKKSTTILQALAMAGGVTDRGSTGRVKIQRLVDGKRKDIKAQLTDSVQSGDTIVVDERFF